MVFKFMLAAKICGGFFFLTCGYYNLMDLQVHVRRRVVNDGSLRG